METRLKINGQNSLLLNDIQSSYDERSVEIDKVGVCDLSYPIIILDRYDIPQHTIGNISISVNLPHHIRGTHMSRFLSVINKYHRKITVNTLRSVLLETKKELNAKSAHIEVSFPYFVEKTAPVSGESGIMEYSCTFIAESNDKTDDFILGVSIPVTSLCPCSKAISDYGAHNQRGVVHIDIRMFTNSSGYLQQIWIEELIEIAEKSASAPIYPLLKREDERYVTMQAYDNPAFVEDIVRNVALHLNADRRVNWYRIKVMNKESIHNHSVFAIIERKKQD